MVVVLRPFGFSVGCSVGCSVVCTWPVVVHHICAVFCKSLVSWAHAVARMIFRRRHNELALLP